MENLRFKFRVWNNKMQKFHIVFSMHGIVNDTLEGYAKDDNFVLEQCTGLKDKNGKLIYEGDVVKIPDNWDEYGFMAGEKREVYFLAGGFRLKPKYNKNDRGCWLEDNDDFEIIGNIHENSELLEQSNDD